MNTTFVPMVQKYDKWHWGHVEAHLEAHNKAQSCFFTLTCTWAFCGEMGQLGNKLG